jgi:hypothetical protein
VDGMIFLDCHLLIDENHEKYPRGVVDGMIFLDFHLLIDESHEI